MKSSTLDFPSNPDRLHKEQKGGFFYSRWYWLNNFDIKQTRSINNVEESFP